MEKGTFACDFKGRGQVKRMFWGEKSFPPPPPQKKKKEPPDSLLLFLGNDKFNI
jgi:hypothetical protein